MRRAAIAFAFMVLTVAHLSPAIAGEAHWDGDNAAALVQYAGGVSRHGLDPSSYDAMSLVQSIDRGDALAVELSASALFERLALDLSGGATPEGRRRRWRIDRPIIADAVLSESMTAALASGGVAEALDGFAPDHFQYRALMSALARTPEGDRKAQRLIAKNMERWRWMPRDLGATYVLVNAPAYEAIFFRAGREVARRRVIVGARKSPTPQFSATVTGVTVNPTWYVPQSIVEESVGALLKNEPTEAARLGYYVGDDGGVRQRPGPGNALGQMKLAMPNPYSVFIHDTPSRKNFDLDKRALSHGCIRVDDALGLAAEILGEDWTRQMLDDLVATGSTVSIDLATPMPVYVVYFTAIANDAGEVTEYTDIYDLDKTVLSSAGDA